MKKIKTKLILTVRTELEYEKDNALEHIETQIMGSVICLFALFNLVTAAAKGHENNTDDKDFFKFADDIVKFAAIGYAFADVIWAAVNQLADYRASQSESEPVPVIQTIAEQLAALVNNPKTPPPIVEGIEQTLNDFFNQHIDQTQFNQQTRTTEHIRQMLENSDYFEIGGETND